MKKIAFVLLLTCIVFPCLAQSEIERFETHFYQSHSIYGSRPFVAKTEKIVGFTDCDVIETDDRFEYDGIHLFKNRGSEYEVAYDVTETKIEEGQVYKDAGIFKTYVMAIKERETGAEANATICVSVDGKGKKNIIVTIAQRLFTGEFGSIETYSLIRE